VIAEPASRVLVRVNEPETEPTLLSVQDMTAPVFIVALPPAAERLLPTVAFDFVPLPVGSRPLLPGPAASTPAGARVATATIDAAASQPAIRRREPRRAVREP
jgi:hypothetical protein